ncbi:MAG: hypothetical protein IPK82_42670 [Polyangiaceae bacterium]|nr:hypothetical protein [Polyangiaceae bacterium]
MDIACSFPGTTQESRPEYSDRWSASVRLLGPALRGASARTNSGTGIATGGRWVEHTEPFNGVAASHAAWLLAIPSVKQHPHPNLAN